MRKEVKLNLIFFVVLLLFVTPGFTILIRKKLQGSADPNHLPEVAPSAAAFNQPPPVPPRLPRVEPTEVRQWVTGLLQQHAGASAMLARSEGGSAPVMGDIFRTQLLSISASAARDQGSTRPAIAEANRRTFLLLWDDRADVSSSRPRVIVTAGSEKILSSPLQATRVEVPRAVRQALQRVGYINPPTTVWLIQADFPGIVDAPVTSIDIQFPGQQRIETIAVPAT